MDSRSEVNAMHSACTTKLSFCARKIDVCVQKIDRFHLDIFRIVIADCLVKNKLRRVRFFQKTFLLANIGLEVVLGMLFVTFSRVDIWFTEQKFVWRTDMTAKALPTTKRVEIINKKKFAAASLNADDEIFVVHIATLAEATTIPIHTSYQT